MEQRTVPEPVIRRIPRYYRLLRRLQREGEQTVSSARIARQMGTTASQVRQDLSHFGSFGYRRHGYDVAELTMALEDILGLRQGLRAVIIGAGDISTALVRGFPFAMCGVTLTAVFAVDGEAPQAGDVPLLPLCEFAQYAAEEPVDIVVLAVSGELAASVMETVRMCPIRGVWNFTGVELDTGGSEIPVEDVMFADSLTQLSYRMAAQERGLTVRRGAALWEKSVPQRLPLCQEAHDAPQRGRFPLSYAEAM